MVSISEKHYLHFKAFFFSSFTYVSGYQNTLELDGNKTIFLVSLSAQRKSQTMQSVLNVQLYPQL